jgi:hypothetical protein
MKSHPFAHIVLAVDTGISVFPAYQAPFLKLIQIFPDRYLGDIQHLCQSGYLYPFAFAQGFQNLRVSVRHGLILAFTGFLAALLSGGLLTASLYLKDTKFTKIVKKKRFI